MTVCKLTSRERATYRRHAALALPRHTSYPIAPVWREDYGPDSFRKDLAPARRGPGPLSLYLHIPFCAKLCYYCACTREIIPDSRRRAHDPAEELLEGLSLEAVRLAGALEANEVQAIHLGGGSPTFLTPAQLQRLWQILKSHFSLESAREMAIEIDPRITSREQLALLRQLGFNRVSLGIQDFAPRVQQAVNRLQPFEVVERVVVWCRELGFRSINFDLIYGLPYQTLESMDDTLSRTLRLGPDRIAFYRLAVIPEMFRWQNVFRAEDLPAGDLPLDLNLLAIQRFQEAGYEHIGLDHFARPEEDLAQARREGSIQRTFQGMTTGKGMDVIGLGPSAISQLEGAFAQNPKASATWRLALEHNLAVERGLRLSLDDRLRREVLQQLYGQGCVEKAWIEQRFDISFDEAFASELERLEVLSEEGLVQSKPDRIELTDPLGRLLARVVAAVFDAYLPATAWREGLPRGQASRVG